MSKPDKTYRLRYILCQCAIVFTLMLLIILSMGSMIRSSALDVIGTSSLAASLFTLFAAPDAKMAYARHMIGGYAIGIFVGIVLCYLRTIVAGDGIGETIGHYSYSMAIFASLSAALTMFGMVKWNVAHPPAMGFSFGLIVEDWHWQTLILLMFVVTLLSLLRWILTPFLYRLVR